jgi:hypothetical protein
MAMSDDTGGLEARRWPLGALDVIETPFPVAPESERLHSAQDRVSRICNALQTEESVNFDDALALELRELGITQVGCLRQDRLLWTAPRSRLCAARCAKRSIRCGTDFPQSPRGAVNHGRTFGNIVCAVKSSTPGEFPPQMGLRHSDRVVEGLVSPSPLVGEGGPRKRLG